MNGTASFQVKGADGLVVMVRIKQSSGYDLTTGSKVIGGKRVRQPICDLLAPF